MKRRARRTVAATTAGILTASSLLAAGATPAQAAGDFTTGVANGLQYSYATDDGPYAPAGIDGCRTTGSSPSAEQCGTSIVIPAVVDGTHPVRGIGEQAFKAAIQTTSVIIPDGVTEIGTDAFGNTGIGSIEIPASVTTLRSFAFTNSTLLTTVRFLGAVPVNAQATDAWFVGSNPGCEVWYPATQTSWIGQDALVAPCALRAQQTPAPPARTAQSVSLRIGKVKKGRAYFLPAYTAQDTPITWTVKRKRKSKGCKIRAGYVLKCKKRSKAKKLKLHARAPGSATLLDYSRTFTRKVK